MLATTHDIIKVVGVTDITGIDQRSGPDFYTDTQRLTRRQACNGKRNHCCVAELIFQFALLKKDMLHFSKL